MPFQTFLTYFHESQNEKRQHNGPYTSEVIWREEPSQIILSCHYSLIIFSFICDQIILWCFCIFHFCAKKIIQVRNDMRWVNEDRMFIFEWLHLLWILQDVQNSRPGRDDTPLAVNVKLGSFLTHQLSKCSTMNWKSLNTFKINFTSHSG